MKKKIKNVHMKEIYPDRKWKGAVEVSYCQRKRECVPWPGSWANDTTIPLNLIL